MTLLGKAVLSVLKRRAVKSLTSRLGAAVTVAGGVAVVDPDVLELIPEHLRGWVVLVVGVGVVLGRHRQEIAALYADLKAAVKTGGVDSPPAE